MARRFFSQAWLSFKARNAAISVEEFVFFEAGYPLVTLTFYCLVAAYSFQTADLGHWVIGNSFLLCMNTCIFNLGNAFSGERYYGRIRSIIVAPYHKLSVVLENGFFPTLVSIFAVLAGLLYGSLVFGISFDGINFFLLLLTILCGMVAAVGFGLLLSVFGLVTDGMMFVLNVSSYVLMIFTGANFPISQLPRWLQGFSRLLPLTRSIEAAKLLYARQAGRELWALLAGEIAVGALYFVLAAGVIRLAERLARKNAGFEMF